MGRLGQPGSVVTPGWARLGVTAEQLGVITFQADLVLVLVVVINLRPRRVHWPAVLSLGSHVALSLVPGLVRLVNVGLQALLSRILALLLRLHQVGLTVWPRPAVFTGSFWLNSGGLIV